MKALSTRLASIDLLRGLAALAVAALHATHYGVWPDLNGPHDLRFFLLLPLSFGGAGVYLFFVISGFCIHLRWAKATAAGKVAANDFVAFWKRRLLRLYPAYAVALLIGIAFMAHDHASLTAANIGSHVLLVHNFHPSTLYSINPVFWTLAIEEQLYLLYFLVLWLRRRYQWPAILAFAFAVRVVWQVIVFLAKRRGYELVGSESAQATWFIWILGAVAVECHVGLIRLPRLASSIWLATILALTTASIVYADHAHASEGLYHWAALVLEQPGWALAAFIAVNAALRAEARLSVHRRSPPLYALLWVGTASYSLYLFHTYVFRGLDLWYVAGLAVAIPLALVAYVLFERPFMRRA